MQIQMQAFGRRWHHYARSLVMILIAVPTMFCTCRSVRTLNDTGAGPRSKGRGCRARSIWSGIPKSHMLVVLAIAEKGNTPYELLGIFLAYLMERHGKKVASINMQLR